MEDLTHLSLFSGIGGIDLAAEWAGFRTVLFVEIDSYCQKVLRKHWSGVPIIGDIRDATKERIMAYAADQRLLLCPSGGNREQARHREGLFKGRGEVGRGGTNTAISSVTLITGGFPCQPVSAAGKRRGKADDRWLWPEMLRVIREIRPTWVVAENVAGLLNMGFNDCVSDLEGEGYETIPFLIPACGVNAPHRRDRIFIVAHATRDRCDEEQFEAGIIEQTIRQASTGESGRTSGTSLMGYSEHTRQYATEIRGSTREGSAPKDIC